MQTIRFLAAILITAATASCGGGSGGSSTSGGSSGAVIWQAVNTPSAAMQINFIDFGANGHWFIADRRQGFYRSTDQGATWTQINSGLSTTFGWTINVDPSNGNLIAATFSSGGLNANPVDFYRSSDEGNSWTKISYGGLSSAPAWSGCAFAANANVVCGGYWAPYPATGGWVSTNSGQTVSAISTASTNGDTVFALVLNPVTNDLWMGTEQNGIFRSTDNGLNWTEESPADTNVDPVHGIRDGNIFAIGFDRSGNVLFGSQGGIWKSSNSGSGFNWTNVLGNSNTSDGKALARDANGVLYYGHGRDTNNPTVVYCSTDDGARWSACDSGLPQFLEAHRFALNPTDRKLYVVVVQDQPNDLGDLYRTVSPVQ